MSDSPPKPAADQTATEATKEAAAATTNPAEKTESSAIGALDEAAKAMDAVVVKSDVPAPAADAAAKDSAHKNPDAPKTDLSKIDPPKPVVDIMALPATTSGMHQQYIAPGVARQSFLSSTKYQFFIFAGMVVLGIFVMRGSMGGDFGLSNATTTGGGPSHGDDMGPNGFPNPNNNVRPPPTPQADFTVNAAAIGDTATPLPRTRPDGGTQNKGGYAEESADLDAAEAMVDKDPVKALQLCDQHDIDYPRGMLDPVARVIRVEAYAKKGEDAKALGLGNEFLEDYPHSPNAGRVIAIVEALKNKLDAGQRP